MIVKFEESFEKDIMKLSEKKVKERLIKIIKEIKDSENLLDIKNLKKLKDHKTFFRIRIGDYRLGLEIINNEVIFTRFLHRKDIYKYFP